jgi:hypothetical protein
MPGKRVQFDDETWRQIDLLGRDQMKDFQELADEAFRDLLKKHGRPIDLKDALRPAPAYRQRSIVSSPKGPAARGASKIPVRISGTWCFAFRNWNFCATGREAS